MQRYMAGDFPRQEQQQRQQPGTARPPLYHAVQLGAYVLEQRGREGASAYASALLPVLPYDMIQGMCRQLGIAAPEKPKPLPPQEGGQSAKNRQPNCGEPDMEMILRLMQLMKGKNGDGADLSQLVKMLGK